MIDYFVVNSGKVVRAGTCLKKLLKSQELNPGDKAIEGTPPAEVSDYRESYRMKRMKAYPPLEEQLDMIFHDGIDAWKATIQSVKDQFPKEA